MTIVYSDKRIIVCYKPAGIGTERVPDLLREELHDDAACIRQVHRLDTVTSGLMIFARSRAAERILRQSIADRETVKEYLAVIAGLPFPPEGRMDDLLIRNAAERKTYVADAPSAEARPASLLYDTIGTSEKYALVHITLLTGRTHQIRAQFSSRGMPIYGDAKYGSEENLAHGIALLSHRISFVHPETGKEMSFSAPLPDEIPWNFFTEKKGSER